MESSILEFQIGSKLQKRRPFADISRIFTGIDNKINQDARNYQKHLEKLTRFVVCGVCGVNDSRNKMVVIDKSMRYVETCVQLSEAYKKLSSSNTQYANDVRQHFNNNGVLKMSNNICKSCHNKIKNHGKRSIIEREHLKGN